MIRLSELKWALLCALCAVFALCACSDDDAAALRSTGRANITMIAPEGSPFGDLSYNDDALNGVLLASHYTNTPLKLLYPTFYTDADSLYRAWLEDNADKDSCVLILSSPVYTEYVRRTPPHITGKGTRILLYESSDTIEGISTVQINRYGISYLAGAMTYFRPATVLAAMKGNQPTDEAIDGYLAGHKYVREKENDEIYERDTVFYLGDSESYFNRPTEAFNFLNDHSMSNRILFPLLGGSNKGVLSYYNMNAWFADFFVGMDVYQGDRCKLVPFSVIINIGELLSEYIYRWKNGMDWEQAKSYNMDANWVEIMTTDNFAKTVEEGLQMPVDVVLMYRQNPDTMSALYVRYKALAAQKEKEYYGN